MRDMLIEVINDGEKLSLMGGTMWLINPGDMPTVCTWTPTAEVEVIKDNKDKIHPYVITNLENDINIRAYKIS